MERPHESPQQRRGDRVRGPPNHGFNRQPPPGYRTGQPFIGLPPRPYQHRPAAGYTLHQPPPVYPSHEHEQPRRLEKIQEPSNVEQYASYHDFQPPPRIFKPSARMSHISAMSSSQPAIDSRPVSEIDSDSVRGLPVEHDMMSQHRYEPHQRSVFPASANKKGKTTIMNPEGSQRFDESRNESDNQAATMEALSAAIRQGLAPTGTKTVTPKKYGGESRLRMPFEGDPGSPTSVRTDITGARVQSSVPPLTFYDHENKTSRPSTVAEHDVDDFDKSTFTHDLQTPKSFVSSSPMIIQDSQGMSSRIPAEKRPPKLNIGAVREAEARGSMTSLTDLIRRATKVASNLDRGRTASRLGHLDMFGSSEKLGANRVRDSTYSDVLNAFPSPAEGVGTPGRDRPNTMWPNGERQHMQSKSTLGRFMDTAERPKRNCCGLSPPLFVLVLIVVVLLIIAAVLVPVFLIVLPNRRQAEASTTCPTTFACHNGGAQVSTANFCSCVCVNGFTGHDCSVSQDPECITASVSDGSRTYSNATVGSSVLTILQDSKLSNSLGLNATTILSTFAFNNLSCASENSLVDFNSGSTRSKRFVIPAGVMSTEKHVPVLNLPAVEFHEHRRFVIVDGLEPAAERLQLAPTRTLQPRQDATQSVNGIVFAGSSTTSAPSSSSADSGATVSTSSTAPSATSSTDSDITEADLEFGGAVVLFVLQTRPSISTAVAANQALSTHFQGQSTANSTVEVVSGTDAIQADFDSFQIILANGTRIGDE